MNADEYHQQQLEYHQQLLIASAEHERDLARESFPRYDVRCMDCGVKVRTSQWQGMTAVCRRCAAINEPVTTFSGHSSYRP